MKECHYWVLTGNLGRVEFNNGFWDLTGILSGTGVAWLLYVGPGMV